MGSHVALVKGNRQMGFQPWAGAHGSPISLPSLTAIISPAPLIAISLTISAFHRLLLPCPLPNGYSPHFQLLLPLGSSRTCLHLPHAISFSLSHTPDRNQSSPSPLSQPLPPTESSAPASTKPHSSSRSLHCLHTSPSHSQPTSRCPLPNRRKPSSLSRFLGREPAPSLIFPSPHTAKLAITAQTTRLLLQKQRPATPRAAAPSPSNRARHSGVVSSSFPTAAADLSFPLLFNRSNHLAASPSEASPSAASSSAVSSTVTATEQPRPVLSFNRSVADPPVVNDPAAATDSPPASSAARSGHLKQRRRRRNT
ncbi:hypothetical protein BDE02_05G111900 [Populus trichocarpa]|nr:hypothetical protein BDE02_05G111900 [Populus trichocarpa]